MTLWRGVLFEKPITAQLRQQIIRPLGNRKVHKMAPLDHILNQMNTIKIRFNSSGLGRTVRKEIKRLCKLSATNIWS